MIKRIHRTTFIKLLIITFIILVSQQVIYGEQKNTAPTLLTANEYSDQYIKHVNKFLEENHMASTELKVSSLNNKYQLVVFNKTTDYLGYIVTNRPMDLANLKLIEYGYGATIPYTADVIIHEELQGIESEEFVYASPFESYWRMNFAEEMIFLDGTNGDWLPDLNKFSLDSSITPSEQLRLLKLSKNYSVLEYKNMFSPSEDIGWMLQPETEKLTQKEIKAYLENGQQVIFLGNKFDSLVSFALPVIGFEEFGEANFYAVYDEYTETTRFIPDEAFEPYGAFSVRYE